jgi:hypothetical protein
MERQINIIPCDEKGVSLELIRLNCLALACLESKQHNKADLAYVYYIWVMEGLCPLNKLHFPPERVAEIDKKYPQV